MPDMDGFKLLEAVALELDVPVMMMSANSATEVVLRGIIHGAVDYLLKPVRIEEIRNIWQHVVRRRRDDGTVQDLLDPQSSGGRGAASEGSQGSKDAGERGGAGKKGNSSAKGASAKKRGADALAANDSGETNSGSGKARNGKGGKNQGADGDEGNGKGADGGAGPQNGSGGRGEHEDSSALKKPRVVWSAELHQQFVTAVNQLGIDKAVPKRILDLMGVQGLTRENVASHLQKYRLYLKRLAGVPPSAPLPADIMQRVHPFQYPGTATASAAAMHAAAGGGAPSFAPTIEQMHAGVPPGTTLTTFPPNAGPSPTDGFDAEALHAQMAATAQFMSYMGAAGAAGGFGPPPGAVGNAGAPGGSEEAAMNAAAMMRQGYSAGYPAMPYGSPPMPAGFMPPPWMVPGAPSLGSGSFHDDPSSRRA